jgi:hypothetical protein
VLNIPGSVGVPLAQRWDAEDASGPTIHQQQNLSRAKRSMTLRKRYTANSSICAYNASWSDQHVLNSRELHKIAN